jgi:hypothetical protein
VLIQISEDAENFDDLATQAAALGDIRGVLLGVENRCRRGKIRCPWSTGCKRSDQLTVVNEFCRFV